MRNYRYLIILIMMVLVTACQATGSPPRLAQEITVYNWQDDLPQEIINCFEQKYHVKINYVAYASQEEALEALRRGEVYDLVVFDSRFVPLLIQENLLAPLNYETLPNFRNIAPSFRDLVYDSGNRYSIPYSWGTIGLAARNDLVEAPIRSWSDLWNPAHSGKIAVWRDRPRLVIGMVLKSLGYSANSENPAELAAAADRLKQIRPGIKFYEDYGSTDIAAAYLSGDVVAGMAFADDYLATRQDIDSLEYVLPAEGALLWSDTFVIPKSSKEKFTAQVFLNYLLDPSISATSVNINHYATANLRAYSGILPELLREPAIFPPEHTLTKAESPLPVSEAAQQLYDEIWKKFLSGAD